MKTISTPSGENDGESFTEWLNWYAIPIAPFGICAEVHTVKNRTEHTLVTVRLEKIVFILSFDVREIGW
jgi:hypothetical protein